MPTYSHYQECKKAQNLENPNRIGACLTCRFWDAEGSRTKELAPEEALCLHPALNKFQLIVSGGSGCNAWDKDANVAPDAEEFATTGA